MVDVSSVTRLTGWLAGWLDGWLAGWLDGWMAGSGSWLVRLTGSTRDRLACVYPGTSPALSIRLDTPAPPREDHSGLAFRL